MLNSSVNGPSNALSWREPEEENAGMSFPEAIKVVMEGGRITRKAWKDPEMWVYLNLSVGYLMFHETDMENDERWSISGKALFATDWVVVGELPDSFLDEI
jgi:hypothetical protein